MNERTQRKIQRGRGMHRCDSVEKELVADNMI